MRINDGIKMKGSLKIVVTGPDGKVKDTRKIDNLVVTTGKQWIAERMDDTPPADMGWMGVGTSGTSPAAGNTALGAQSARVANDSQVYAGQKMTYTATFAPGVATAALQEAGIFNAASAGAMLSRVTFAVINKGAADQMVITWDINVN